MAGDMVTVYRIEHPESGGGPWKTRNPKWCGFRTHDGHHPSDLKSPNDERDLDGIMPHEVCACRDLNQLRRWFHVPHLRDLQVAGFVLKRITVPRDAVRFGDDQVLVSKNFPWTYAVHPPLQAMELADA